MTHFPTTIVVHSGPFHADDVFAASMLLDLFPLAQLIRTRDDALIAQKESEGAIIVDIGGIYDHDRKRYDHHQIDRAIRDSDDKETLIPYSGFGLIWKHYGRDYLKSVHGLTQGNEIRSTWEQFDRKFVIRIDMYDNKVIPKSEEGILNPMSISKLIGDFMPDFDDTDAAATDAAFLEAVALARILMKNKIRKIREGLRSERKALASFQNRIDPRWAELPNGMPYMGALRATKATDVLYVIMPDNEKKNWNLCAVRSTSGVEGCKKPLPKSWAGMRDESLEAATGVKGAIFCHIGRFLAVADSREGAFELLYLALAHEEVEQVEEISAQA